MAVIETARKAVETAQARLNAAQTRAEAEAHARAARNAERRTTFWEGVLADELPQARQAFIDSRDAFTAAVLDGGDAVGSYLAHVKAHAAHKAINNATCSALVVYVNDLTGKPHPDPTERWGRPTYPGDLTPMVGDPQAFVDMLQVAVKEAHEAHARAAVLALTAPLTDQLEPEGDQ